MSDAPQVKKQTATSVANALPQQKAKKFPDHPLGWLTYHADKVNRVRDEIFELLQSPEGVEKLKRYTGPKRDDDEKGAQSKKVRFVLKAMQKDPKLEEDVYHYVKMRAKLSGSRS